MGGMEVQAANLNRTTKTRTARQRQNRCSEGCNGGGRIFQTRMEFPLQDNYGNWMAAGGLWIREPAGSGKTRRRQESIGDWWSEDLRLEREAGTEGRSGEGRSGGEPFLMNNQPAMKTRQPIGMRQPAVVGAERRRQKEKTKRIRNVFKTIFLVAIKCFFYFFNVSQ